MVDTVLVDDTPDTYGRPAFARYDYANRALIAGPETMVANPVLLARSDRVYKRGDALGRVANGLLLNQWVLSALTKEDGSAVNDGSQTPARILAQDTDCTLAAASEWAYEAGEFDIAMVNYGPGHTVDTVASAFEGTPIHFHTVAPAGDVLG